MNNNDTAVDTAMNASSLSKMISEHFHLVLADDDKDDCLFFKDALDELPVKALLTTVHDGEQLMQLLTERTSDLPRVLFLDLNMPRKNGFECLTELKDDETLKDVPVIVFSTSFEQDVVNLLYKKGGQYYIRKPAEFSQLKKAILQALTLISEGHATQPAREDFVITGHSDYDTSQYKNSHS